MTHLVLSVLRRLSSDRRGNVAVAVAITLPVIALVVGGAMDVHHASGVRTDLQNAVDASTLAVARDRGADARGQAMMQSHIGSRRDVMDWTAVFTQSGNDRTLGEASATLSSAFLGIIGIPVMTVRAKAEAAVDGGSAPCLTLLDPNAGQALLVNSGARLIAPECEVHVRSTGNPAAIFNAGSRLDVARVCVRGARIIDNGGRPDRLDLGCDAVTDPFAGRFPPIPAKGCTDQGRPIDRGPVTFRPGVYCGGMNFNGRVDVKFEPGLYVLRGGDWNVNGGAWRGEGVTFYFEDTSRIQFNSGIDARLSAPTSGDYKDLLFFEKPGLAKSAFIFNDTGGNQLDGIMHLPSRNMTYNSGSDTRGDRLAMVFNTLIINQTTWRLGPPKGASGKSAPRLVR